FRSGVDRRGSGQGAGDAHRRCLGCLDPGFLGTRFIDAYAIDFDVIDFGWDSRRGVYRECWRRGVGVDASGWRGGG
ncbi:hypothetical protein GY26_03550, partial [Gammaproteobacteria bacterium MFB021]